MSCANYIYRGVGIEMTSHVFYFELELLLRSILSALQYFSARLIIFLESLRYFESQMLQKMSSAVRLIRFRS